MFVVIGEYKNVVWFLLAVSIPGPLKVHKQNNSPKPLNTAQVAIILHAVEVQVGDYREIPRAAEEEMRPLPGYYQQNLPIVVVFSCFLFHYYVLLYGSFEGGSST